MKIKIKMKMKMHHKFTMTFLILGCLLIVCSSANAQGNNGVNDIVDVETGFDAKLADANKINLKPSIAEKKEEKKNMEYSALTDKMLPLEYPAPQVRPISFKSTKLSDVYNGYLKIGAGTPKALLGEFNYSKLIKERFKLDLDLNHHYANNCNHKN